MAHSRRDTETVKTELVHADNETCNPIRNDYYKQAEGLMGLREGLKDVMANATGDAKDELEEAIATLAFAEDQIETLKLGQWI